MSSTNVTRTGVISHGILLHAVVSLIADLQKEIATIHLDVQSANTLAVLVILLWTEYSNRVRNCASKSKIRLSAQ